MRSCIRRLASHAHISLSLLLYKSLSYRCVQVHQIKPATDRPADPDGSGFSESNRWEHGQLIEVAQEVRGGDPPEYKLAGACAIYDALSCPHLFC